MSHARHNRQRMVGQGKAWNLNRCGRFPRSVKLRRFSAAAPPPEHGCRSNPHLSVTAESRMANQEVDTGRRRFLTATTAVVGGAGAAMAAIPFLKTLQPSARAKVAGAPVTEDISKLEVGQRLLSQWRGQPIWIIRRTPEQLAALPQQDGRLRDPNSDNPEQQPEYAKNPYRSIKPEILVLVGTCTRSVRQRMEGRLLLPLPQLALRSGRSRLSERASTDQPQSAAVSLPR